MSAPEPAPVEAVERQPWRAPRWAQRALFEGLLIVFSVILALTVTSWADDRRTAGRVEEMRGFLRAELQANRETLRDANHLPHHRRLRDAFREPLKGGGDIAPAEARDLAAQVFSTGLHPTQLQDAVWSSLSNGDLMEHMRPTEVFALARVYRAQAQLDEVNRQGYDRAIGLFDLLEEEGIERRRITGMSAYLEDMVFQEEELGRLYDQALADLGSRGTHKGLTRRPARR